MKISETFTSIQGEGPMQGRPAFFIRMAGCNLSCTFCDTQFARNPYVNLMAVTSSELRDKMLELSRQYGLDYQFVFTGGEPLIQDESICDLLNSYYARSVRLANVWFETNGTITPSKTLVKRLKAKFVVSPKVGHLNEDALKALSELGAHFKFVIDNVGTDSWHFTEAMALCEEYEVPRERIWMQPMATKSKDVIKAGQALWVLCDNEGVNFSPRLHSIFWSSKRGK